MVPMCPRGTIGRLVSLRMMRPSGKTKPAPACSWDFNGRPLVPNTDIAARLVVRRQR